MYNVVFYSESSGCGGHETMAVMASKAIKHYHEQIATRWIISASNTRLATALDNAGTAYSVADLEPTFRYIRNPLAILRKANRTKRLLSKLKPDLLVLVQGGITDGIDGVLAAWLAGVPVCSYIPVAQTPAQFGLRRFGRMRTAGFSLFFKLISRYITIDEQQVAYLRHWRKNAQTVIVENLLRDSIAPAQRSPEAKERLGLPTEFRTLGVIGRISFWQKAQDWLVKALDENNLLEDKTLVFVGDGPDSSQLSRLIETSPWRTRLYQIGWNENLDHIYEAVDVLLIPSRAEGVPLVMLEALARRIPVVATDRDGMKSWLPPEWRFPFGDMDAMTRAIDFVLSQADSHYWVPIMNRLTIAKDEHRFGRQFGDALIGYCVSFSRPQ